MSLYTYYTGIMNNIKILPTMSKEDIKKALKDKARKRAKLELDLENPQTLQEKINWLIVYGKNNTLKAKCADKILLHEYCKEKLGEDICVPILQIYNKPEDINIDILPDKFVLKCNHGYAMNIIVDKKTNSFTTLKRLNINNIEDCKTQLKQWLNTNFGDINYQEHYALIHPQCYAEQFMCDGHKSLTDYKVMCFNGEPKMIQVVSDRYTNNIHANNYDTQWNWFDLGWSDFPQDKKHLDEKPKEFDKMLKYAKLLSADFELVRVDFYVINDRLYLGELTFTPDGGIFRYKNRETDLYWGSQLKLT